MSKGIYMLALGHPNYGKMAAVLAASMKLIDEEIKIALFHDGEGISTLSDQEAHLFDETIKLDTFYYTNDDDSFNPIKARLYADEQTPFDETLCIDVDNIWISKTTPTEVMQALSDASFTIANNGYTIAEEDAEKKFSPWADLQQVMHAYDIKGKRFYNTSGEWFYFKKDETAFQFFDVARDIFHTKPSIKVSTFIGQQIPDELAFAIAIAKTELYPHENYYRPSSWNIPYKKIPFWMLRDRCFTLCMGGSKNSNDVVQHYNFWSKHVYQKMGIADPYLWKQKHSFIPERKLK